MTKFFAWLMFLSSAACFCAGYRTQTLITESEQMQREVSCPAPRFVEMAGLCDNAPDEGH